MEQGSELKLDLIGNKSFQPDTDEDRVLSLAEQFIAAMPDRIKNESEPMDASGPPSSSLSFSSMMPPPSLEDMNSVSDDLGIESMCGDAVGDFDLLDFSENHMNCSAFDDAIFSYRDSASLSPATSCSSYLAGLQPHSVPPLPQSPSVASSSPFVEFTEDSQPTSPGPPAQHGSPRGTAADLQEFLQSKCEQDLSNLTLSDQEQRELYEAAQIIQKAYRTYRNGRNKKEAEADGPGGATLTSAAILADEEEGQGVVEEFHQAREAKAAVVIQNYYRRYKQYLYWKRVQARAATVIQTKFREHKRFKKSQEAATCIQTYYRTYKEQQTGSNPGSRASRESTPGGAGVK